MEELETPQQGETPESEQVSGAEPEAAVSVEELLAGGDGAQGETPGLVLMPVPVEDVQLRAVLEAVIYLADEPLTVPQIAAALGQPAERVRPLLEQLVAEFEKPEHGVSIREVAGGYKMATKPEHHETVRNFVKSLKPPLKLSLPALETLAVIAYKQPVTSPEIMEIRGVQGTGVLKTLLDRKLIAAAGRKNVIGKPMLYKTTKEFLIQFGLKDLSELPSLKEFEEIRRLAFSDGDAAADPAPAQEEAAGEAGPAAEAAPADAAPAEAAGEAQPVADVANSESAAGEAAPAESSAPGEAEPVAEVAAPESAAVDAAPAESDGAGEGAPAEVADSESTAEQSNAAGEAEPVAEVASSEPVAVDTVPAESEAAPEPLSDSGPVVEN